MIIYFADRQMNILGMATTSLPNTLRITDDVKIEEIENGTTTFECVIHFTKKSQLSVQEFTEAGNFLLRGNGNEAEAYTIIETEIDVKAGTVKIYCEDVGMDLLNEVFGDYAPGSQNIETYIKYFASDSGFKIGVNELGSGVKKSIKYEGENTALERLSSVASNFGCNISFSFAINNLSITKKNINIWKKRGRDNGATLRLGKEVNNIITSKSVANVATRILAYGATLEGKNSPINLKSYVKTDGDFYTEAGSYYVYSKSAQEKWKRNWLTGLSSGGEITQRFTDDSCKTQAALFNAAKKKLIEMRDTQINYEVDIVNYDDLRIGDYVRIVDDNGELYLKARVLNLETSIANESIKAVLGEFALKRSGISDKIEQMAKEWMIAKIYSISIESSEGTIYKGIPIDTTLTAHVYRNNTEVDGTDLMDFGATVKWYRGETLLGSGLTYHCTTANNSDSIRARLEVKSNE